jgi:phage shock protein A
MNEALLLLKDIEAKVKILLEKNRTLQSEYETLKQEYVLLKTTNELQKEKIAELENQLKIIKLAKTVAGDTDNDAQRAELKRKIDEMIKEIDHCVALLNT